MYDDVSESSGQEPHLIRVFCPELRRSCTASLAHDHQVMHNPSLKEFFIFQSLPPADGVLFNALNGLKNIPEPLPIIPHRGAAS